MSAGGLNEGSGENCAADCKFHPLNPNQPSLSPMKPSINFSLLANGVVGGEKAEMLKKDAMFVEPGSFWIT